MKDPKEIKYETGEYDEAGNPVYITEAEFREHGIITEEPPEYKPSPIPKDKLNVRFLIQSILVGILIFFISIPFLGGLGVLFYVGIAHCQTGRIAEGIVICIITGGAILLIIGFAVLMGIGRYRRLMTPDFIYKKKSDGIEGTYETFGYTRPNGTKVTHVFKKDD